MTLPDWNHNGKRDAFDAFVDMKIIDAVNKTDESTNDMSRDKEKREITGISMGGKPLYDATKDSDGIVAFKSLCATDILISGIVIPVKEGMKQYVAIFLKTIVIDINVVVFKGYE